MFIIQFQKMYYNCLKSKMMTFIIFPFPYMNLIFPTERKMPKPGVRTQNLLLKLPILNLLRCVDQRPANIFRLDNLIGDNIYFGMLTDQ